MGSLPLRVTPMEKKKLIVAVTGASGSDRVVLHNNEYGTRQPQSTGAIFASVLFPCGENNAARHAGASPGRGLCLLYTGKHRLCHDMKAEKAKPR